MRKVVFHLPEIDREQQKRRIEWLLTNYPSTSIFRRNIRSFVSRCAHSSRFTNPILDIGCGYRSNEPEVCSEELKDFYTLDIDVTVQPNFVENAENMRSIPSETFSSVICTEVLEHTKNPTLVCQEIHRILKASGSLVLTVPFWVPIHRKRNQEDYWRFTPAGVEALLNGNGFVLELMETKGEKSSPEGIFVVASKA